MKKLLFIILVLFSTASFAQTTPIHFTQQSSSVDIVGSNRGAQQWNGSPWDNSNDPYIPASATQANEWYTRFLWGTDIETSQGVYNFSVFDSRINQAIDAGQIFSFGIMPMCTGCISGNVTYPQYLHTLMQAETPSDWFSNVNGSYIPNWNSPSYQARWRALVQAVAAHIATGTHSGKNYRDVIGYVDIRGYGETGEWNTYPWFGTEPAGTALTVASGDSIINAVGSAFPNNQLVICFGVMDPGNASLMPPGVSTYFLNYTNNRGHIGWRRDNLGDPGFDGSMDSRTGILTQYKVAPVGGEPNNDATDAPYGDLPREILHYGASYFGNGNWSSVNASNATFVANARQASLNSGYREQLDTGYSDTNPSSGGAFHISLSWKNVGIAPVYYPWNVTYELRNGATVVWTGTSYFSPKLFLPAATDSVVTDNFTLTGVAAGTYNLYLIVRDPVGYRPPLPFTITGRNSDGSYLLRTGVTVTSSGSPVANAGPDQVITLPTSSANLTGAASTGTITSYAWTQISGPNSASITTSSSVTTSVTGLIQGIYVFQLSLNSGVSTDQVQITVNPTPPPVANAGADQTFALPQNSTTLNGSLSTGTITSYLWTQIAGPNSATLTNANTVSATASNLIQGTYTFQLSLNGGASTDQMNVTVNPVTPVVANAGVDQSISLPTNSVTVNGNGSTGPITSYLWTEISGPNTATITSATSVQTTITGLIAGTYTFQLGLNGGASTDQMNVVVNPAVVGATVFNATAPAGNTPILNDGQSLELGMKFQSSVPGFVTGARFYKLTGFAGTQTGELYSYPAGVRLASATYTNETASGWQTVTFGSQVAITANTTYVIAMFSSSGDYVDVDNYFTSAVVSGVLTGLKDGTAGPNGVYQYSGSPVYPTSSSGVQANYWVDVLFSANNGVANAGSDQILNFPSTSTTLNGTGSTGTIANYSWTKISGPNNPTITSPTSITTTVTGLVQGTYVFQLSVNNGASTDQVTITLNGPPPATPPYNVSKTVLKNR